MFSDNKSVLEDLLNRIGETLQLTPTKHDLAVAHYTAVGEWLAKDAFLAPFNPTVYAQGSFAIGTTVRPLGRDEYDLDLVVELDDGAYTSQHLYNAVGAALRKNDRYAKKLSPKKRCWRLTYEHDFHMDILPARPDKRPQLPKYAVVVPDRELQHWKESNPKGYAGWFDERGILPKLDARFAEANIEPAPAQEPYLGKPPLTRGTQLLKRWRDVKWHNDEKNAPISIVLTTLAAEGYGHGRSVVDAMDQILASIISRIPPVGRLKVMNPKNPLEDFSERWDSDPVAYQAFVQGIRELAAEWRAIRGSAGLELYDRLGKLFGTELANRVVKEHAAWAKDLQDKHRLGVTSRGIVTATSATAPAAAAAQVRPNQFFGKG